METGSVTALKLILILLAANVIVILAAYGLIAWWRKQSQAAIRKIGASIKTLDVQMGQLAQFLIEYKEFDREPFFTPLEELQTDASDLESRVHRFLDTCRAYEAQIYTPIPNRFQAIVNAPVVWFRHWRRSVELRRESEELAGQMAASEQRMQKISGLPWDLATECRQADQEAGELAHTIEWLRSKGTQGTNFQKATSQVPVILQEINAIPPIFLQAEREDLLAAANMTSTIRVFEGLSRLRPALDRYLPQAREWRANLEKASAGYAGLKRAGGNLRQAFASPPPGLIVAPLEERLDQVAQMANDINQQLSQPNADSLKSLAREVGQLMKVLQDTEHQYTRAVQQVGELRRVLEERKGEIEKLSEQFTALERTRRYPLDGDASHAALDEVRQKLSSLGSAQQPRTPEQIYQHRALLDSFQAVSQRLSEQIPQVASQHAALVALLDSGEIRGGTAWLQKARAAFNQAAGYDVRNWSKKDAPQGLTGELDQAELLQKKISLLDQTAPMKETALASLLEDAQALAALYQTLRPRVEALQARLEKIRGLEEQGKDNLNRCWSALEKVALLAESNEFVDEIVGVELDQLGEEIRHMGNELNNHGQGEIEKKAQHIQILVDRNNQALNRWISRLSTEVTGQARQLGEQMTRLEEITHLEDPTVEDARVLLQREEIRSALNPPTTSTPQSLAEKVANKISPSGPAPALNDLETLAELKRKSDLWQMLAAAQRALVEKSTPLLAAHVELMKARDDAREQLGEVAANFPEKRAWPPNNQVSLPEAQTLRPVDEKWDALKKKTARSDAVIPEMGRLTQQYRLIAERARQLLGRIEQDYERIQELEWQIDSLKDRWQSQVIPGNSILREGVQLLLSQTDSKLAYIKQQCMRGTLSYEQCIQNLQLLYDELFSAQVPVDEQNKIGLDEPHRPAEQRA